MIEITDKEIYQCEVFLRLINQPIFGKGTYFSRAAARKIASIATSMADIDRLVTKEPCQYAEEPFFIQTQCKCGFNETRSASKTKTMQFIKSFRGDKNGDFIQCIPCTVLEQERKTRERAEYVRDFREISKRENENFIETVTRVLLNPNSDGKDGLKFWDMKTYLELRGNEICKKLISKLPYMEFLKTQYWKLCSSNVKKKAGFKCQMCNSPNNLSTHHRTYEFHGLEHTTEGQRSLTCVCQACHNTHHFPSFEEHSKTNIYAPDEEIIAY